MPLTEKMKEVLAAAPIKGEYILPLGAGAGRWSYFIGNNSVTRQVNRLVADGMMITTAMAAGPTENHPRDFTAVADATDAGRAALAVH